MNIQKISIGLLILGLIVGVSILPASADWKDEVIDELDKQPNFLLIVADDLGWTDIGCFGSEIRTPNLDVLAQSGVKFTEFYVSVTCSPTRSMLLSGTDNHIAGLGNMSEGLTPEQRGQPGYEGYLNDRVVSLAEVLRDGGYHTYMSGKWHLGEEPDQYPHARGFERSFSMLYGGASYWSDMYGLLAETQETAKYVMNDKEVKKLPKDFYATRNYSDFLMHAIREDHGDGKPFLAYLAFTAVHDPIHVPEPWLSQYRGSYDDGYGVLKAKRAAAAQRMGLIPSEAPPAELYHLVEPWESLSQERRALESRAMEVYAGMVSNMDYHIGRVLDFLKDIDEYDNTVIIFLSDNGSNPWYSEDYPGNLDSEFMAQFDNSLDNLGRPMSHYAYGTGWASASSGPLDLFKLVVGEGGIRSPAIIAGPGVKGGRQSDAFSYVTDIMPTILDLAGLKHPGKFRGHKVEPMRGHSMAGILSGVKETIYKDGDFVGGEMANGKWMRQGDFKAIFVQEPYGLEKWQLFNVEEDPGETRDLADEQPKLLKKLKVAWDKYARKVGVVLYEK
ncbi:MAG: arylsulfatase [Proteobacteria bacterium]|nr:arylsulfatase [Pseudomonadota bacterium]